MDISYHGYGYGFTVLIRVFSVIYTNQPNQQINQISGHSIQQLDNNSFTFNQFKFKFNQMSFALRSLARARFVSKQQQQNLLLQKSLSPNLASSTTSVRHLTFTDEHDKLRDSVRKIIDKDVNPFVDEWEEKGAFPAHQVFKKFGDAGLMGITRDPEYGGSGLDYSYSIAFFEELSRVNCGGVVVGLTVQTDMALPALANFGSDELKRQFLAPSVSGDYVACVGVSEITGGSDVAALKTYAKRDGDDLIINGSKMWISNGAQADWMCMLANTTPDRPVHRNKSLICVPMDLPGITVARKIDKLGLLCSDTAEIYFDNVRVPAKNIIGEENEGFTYQMIQFQDERLCSAASTMSSLDRMIDGTIEYCRERRAFDMPLIDNQYIHFKLAELKSEVELLRSLVYRAADGMIAGDNVTYLASIAKLKVGRLSRIVADSCLQFYGGMGFTKENLISRSFRDSRVISIAGGTDEMMLGIISSLMGILPKKKRTADQKLNTDQK